MVIPLLWYLCTITLYSSVSHGNLNVGCNVKDRETLEIFKGSIADPGNLLSSWSSEQDCCHWFGVHCDHLTGRVTMLDLHCPLNYFTDNNYGNFKCLGGQINLSVLKLEFLSYLDLHDNDFYAFHIPSVHSNARNQSSHNISNLLFLDLSYNSYLQIHDLRWILQLSSLRHLDLSYVHLTREIFGVKSVVMLPLLLELRLSHCFLNTITHPYLGSVNFSSSLELLDISENFYYEIPKWLFNLSSSISYLDLSFNHLTGQIPKAMSNFWHLQFLFLKSNHFSGSIPEWVGQYQKLEQLDISSNYFWGPIPDSLENISSLVHLDVRHNQLNGSLPKSLGQLSKLQRFFAGHNKLSGPISLFLCQTESRNENLEVLEMSHNHFSGLLSLCWMHQRKYLKMILLQSNNFFGPIPQQICQLSNLKMLDLADNKLTGSIPRCLGNITAMAGASSSDLSINNYNYTSKRLMIGEDYFRTSMGYIPLYYRGSEQEFRPNVLKYFFIIDLSKNDLSGSIPQELFSLVALRSLNLSHNHLLKSIPVEIGQMERLEILDLSRNQLVGEIPQSLCNLRFLNVLNLSYNNLSGKIPLGIQLLTFNATSYMGNPELYGAPLTEDNTEDETPNSQDGIPSEKKHSNDDQFKAWFYIGLAIGFAYGFWGVCLALFYVSTWRHAYFRFLNNVNDRIYVFVALKTKWLRLKLEKWQYHK